MADIKREPVTSSNVASVGFDPETRTLEVQFKSGGTYRHVEVPQSVYDGFMAADSKGGFYSKAIKGKYAHHKV
jgi:hypothetical protein